MPAETDFQCDGFVLCLPDRVTIDAWCQTNEAARQAPLLRRLAERSQVVVVAERGDRHDAERAGAALPEGVRFVGREPCGDIGQAVQQALNIPLDGARIITRTHEMHDGGASARIAGVLRGRGAVVGRIARGGHLRSRFLARQLGADAPETRAAGLIERELCVTCDVIVGTTGKMADDLAWRWGLGHDQIRVIPNFIDDEQDIASAEQREQGLIVVLGDLVAHKNIDVILQAVGAMPRAQRGSILVRVLGSGPEDRRLRALAGELGVGAEFVPEPTHEQILESLGACGAYVQASAYEGHPIELIEAMASGAPVIVADSPGLGRIVDNGVSGVLVPGTAESLTYAISGVLEDEGWREMLGQSAAIAARRRYGIDKVIELELEAHGAALRSGERLLRKAG